MTDPKDYVCFIKVNFTKRTSDSFRKKNQYKNIIYTDRFPICPFGINYRLKVKFILYADKSNEL